MANREKLRIKSALKRSKQNIKRNALKSSQRALTRTAVKAVNAAIDSGDKQSASEALKKLKKHWIKWLTRRLFMPIKLREPNHDLVKE